MVEGITMYSRPRFNFTGKGVKITESGNIINFNIPETVLTNVDGNSIIRLGVDGGTTYSSITITDTTYNELWQITITNAGELITELVPSGTPIDIILKSENNNLYLMDIERTFGSGEIKTSQVFSGIPFNFSLTAQNGKSWIIKTTNSGEIYSLDPDNLFQVQNADGENIFTVKENGMLMIKRFEESAVSGNPLYVPSPLNISGELILSKSLDDITTFKYSDGTKWNELSYIKKYKYEQIIPSTIWYVNHNLGTLYYTSQIFNLSNIVILPLEIKSIDENNTQITFNSSVSGIAFFVG
jgi:hypothetical protein